MLPNVPGVVLQPLQRDAISEDTGCLQIAVHHIDNDIFRLRDRRRFSQTCMTLRVVTQYYCCFLKLINVFVRLHVLHFVEGVLT